MAPKKAQPTQKAPTQPRAAAPLGLQQSPTKPATKKVANPTTAQPEPPVEDDFDDFDYYRQWVRRADKDDPEVFSPKVRREWEMLSSERAAAFANAVRAFQDDEGVQAAAEVELREVLQNVSNFKLGDERQRRDISRGAGTLHKALVKALGVWQLASEQVLLKSKHVGAALTTLPREGLQPLLETYQRRLRKSIESAEERINSWIRVFDDLAPADLWTLEHIRKFQDSAKEFESKLPTVGLSLQPPAGSSSASSKRKRHDDTNAPDPKAPRKSRTPDVAGSGSARSGAALSQQHAPGPRDMGEHDEQAKGVGSVNQDVAGLGLQHHGKGTAGRQRSTPDAASRTAHHTPPSSSNPPDATQPEQTADAEPTGDAHLTPQALPLPSVGVAHPFTAYFRDHAQACSPPFLSWCRPQFIQNDFRTLEDCEPLAEALFIFQQGTLPDHDWENEPVVQYLPFTSEDFDRGCVGQTLWGNLRRLHVMRESAPVPFREYLDRNVMQDGWFIENAESVAKQVISLAQAKGLSHDWDTEADIAMNHPSVETTRKYPLEALAGNWNFRGVVGKGGNGRALLYCKYDSAGNILQRMISKESLITKYWNSPYFWSGPVASRMPIEAAMHRLLPRSPHVIQYLGFHVSKQLRMVRHHTAFAELGDLMSLYDNHEARVNAVDEHGVALPPPSIPVVAIIYMFQAMAAGACLMAHGAVPDDEGNWPGDQSPDWNYNIIHRDIKPLNYFLSSSEGSVIWPKLPIVALGDFGNAVDIAGLADTRSVRGGGTPHWMAPEQSPTAPATHAMSPATNVYQIGLPILQLMYLKIPEVQTGFGYDKSPFPGFSDDETFYPQDLINIAEDCTQELPADRPTPVDLYRSIRDLASSYPDKSNKVTPWQLQTIPPGQLLRTKLDGWAV